MTFDRADPIALQKRLARSSSKARKALGQHFLIDRSVIEAMLGVRPLKGGRIVEIGPGPGILTEALLQQKAELTAYELDPLFIAWLKEDFPHLRVIEGSILDQAALYLPVSPYRVVANIPYGITNPLLRLFLENTIPRPRSMTMLVQYEIAQRLAAGPGQTGRGFLSVLAQNAATVTLVKRVPATSFWPPPKVQSAVIDLQLHETPTTDTEQYLRFVRRAFTTPRKQLKNVLAGIRGVSQEEIVAQFSQLGLPATVRSQELSGEQWRQLFEGGV